MHRRLGWLISIALVVTGVVGGAWLSVGAVAATGSQPLHGTSREGETSPSLLVSEDKWTYFLPLVSHHRSSIPGAPVLTAPGNLPATTPSYTLSWSLPPHSPDATVYDVEESRSPAFTPSIVYTTTETSMIFTGKAWGHYYYRVRGLHEGKAGPWSTIGGAYLSILNDEFTGPVVPWSVRRTSAPDASLMTFHYLPDDIARTQVDDRFDFAIFSPLVPAPPDPYSIRIRSRVAGPRYNLTSYGLVWGGSQGSFCGVERLSAARTEGCFSSYYRLNIVWAGNYWKYSVHRIDYHESTGGGGRGVQLVDWHNLSGRGWDPRDWHVWEVYVVGNEFHIYVNDIHVHTVYDRSSVRGPYYGIFSSTNEYNNAHFDHDYFLVRPLD